MKKLLILLAVLSAYSARAQDEITPAPGYGASFKHLVADSTFRPPVVSDTICTLFESEANGTCFGALVILLSDSVLYQNVGTHWRAVGKMPDLSTYMKYSDTAAMLIPYLRKADTASLSNRINDRLTITAAAATYIPFTQKGANNGVATLGATGKIPTSQIALTTSDVPEGTNLYWTNARGDARYPLLTGSYANPTWLTSLAWSKLTGVPTAFNPAAGSNNYVQNQELAPQPVNYLISGKGRADRGISGHNWITMSSGTNAMAGIGVNFFFDPTNLDKMVAYDTSSFGARGIVFRTKDSLFNEPYFFNTGNNYMLAGDEITPDYKKMWHEGNDGSGSGLDADLLDGLSSASFASASNAAGYVWNQTATDQAAGLRVSGRGLFGTAVGIGNNSVNPVAPLDVRGPNGTLARLQSNSSGTQRALIISADNVSADVGLAASGAGSGNMVFLTGTTERARISMSTGFYGINENSMGAMLDVKGSSSSTGSAFRVRNSTPSTLFEVANNGVIALPNGVLIVTGTGSPEGVVTAPVASEYFRTDGATGTAKYIKETGTGNTGWAAVNTVPRGYGTGSDANYTVSATEKFVILPQTTATRTITLPSSNFTGRELFIRCAGATWQTDATGFIPVSTTGTLPFSPSQQSLTSATVYHLVWNGTAWVQY